MVFCPECGYENEDTATSCLHCGHQLIEKPIRKKIVEHLKYTVYIIEKYPKILVPETILNGISLITGLFFFKLTAPNFINYIQNLNISNINYQNLSYILVGTIVGLLLDSLYNPFKQYLYLKAVEDKEPSYNNSFLYAKSRYFDFLKANFIITLFCVLFLASSLIPLDDLIIITFGGGAYQHYLLILIIGNLIAILLILWITSAIEIMVWDETGFKNALRVTLKFLRARFVVLFLIGIIAVVVEFIMNSIPFGSMLEFLTTIFFRLVNIDVFLSYRKTG